jgi:hypothetical protein
MGDGRVNVVRIDQVPDLVLPTERHTYILVM